MIQFVLLTLLLVLIVLSFRSQRQYRFNPEPISDHDLPTVSLLIPARNETHAVSRSLLNVLSIDYPKLEIIVLNDESADNTSEKIRSFARDGIRFINGKKLPTGWIGKNWACHQLAESASGEYLIFCDIDVHPSSKTVTGLIKSIDKNGTLAVTALPRLHLHRKTESLLVPLLPWFMTLMRPLAGWQPAYGGLMAFNSSAYKRHGGHGKYPGEMLAELKIASDFRHKYRFYIDDGQLNSVLYKKPSSLNDSRVRYLSYLYRTDYKLAMLHFGLVAMPLVVPFINPWLYLPTVGLYATVAYKHLNLWLVSSVFLPLTCIWELFLVARSFVARYKRSVRWKDRAV